MADRNLGSQVPLPNEEKVDFDLFGPSASPPGIGSAGRNGPDVLAQAAGSAAGSPRSKFFHPSKDPTCLRLHRQRHRLFQVLLAQPRLGLIEISGQ